MFSFLRVITREIAVIRLALSEKKGACGLKCKALEEHKSAPPPAALNHSLPAEFISHPTSDSSARCNKELNPATPSLEVKPSLSSDSSGREG